MIPKYLKLKGLYSYQTEQEIDFTPLTDAALFGVFGAVGSGKSSILEAITFALYGDTERLNKSGDDRTYNMMNLRSDELLIDFECIAGKDGGRYRFTVRGRRNAKNFKDVKTFERKAYVWENESWVPLSEQVSAEDIIGLSYENFRRTIIIPQGRFQEFIELRDAERTRMMKELFQLEKYDLSRNVGSLSKQNDLEIANKDGQITSLGSVTEELISVEKEKMAHVQSQIKEIQAELTTQTAQELKYQNLKAAAEKIELLKTQVTALKEKQPEMLVRETALKTYESCSLHFKSLFDQKKNLVNSLAKDQNQQQTFQTRNKGLSTLLEKQKETVAQLQPRYATRETLLDTADELEKVIQIKTNQGSIAKRQDALIRGAEQLKVKVALLETLKASKVAKETENDLRKTQLADVQEMGLIKSWFTTFDNLAENRQLVKNEADKLQKDIAAQQQLLTETLREIRRTLNALTDISSPEEFQIAIQDYLFRNDTERKLLSAELLKINTRAALQQFAVTLEEGEPCPLCGSSHHPHILHQDESIQMEAKAVEAKIEKVDERNAWIRKMQSPVERIFNQIDNLESQKKSIKARWNEIKVRIDEHDKVFTWPKFDKNNRAGFEAEFEKASQNQQLIREAEAILKKLSQQIEAEETEKTEKIEKPLQALKEEVMRLENTVSTLSGQLVKVDIANFENTAEQVVMQEIEALKKSYQEITSLFEQTEKEVDKLEKEQNILSGSLATLQVSIEADQKSLETVQGSISAQLAAFAFESEAQVTGILSQSIHIESERKEIESFKFALETTSRELENHLNEAPSETYNAEQHAAATLARETLNAALTARQKEEGGLDSQIKKLAADLARKTQLEEERGKLMLRKQHLDDLARLFRSSGFVDYASSIYLQNLIQAANHRFHQMTHQQLHLELGEGNSFWVRDLLNGGHLRLLKTLSGGQKFQAALSLALALADHIHLRNESKHNFFFLDEGFGSLDKNALQTVFETLKSLRKENRIVGIISHVEDLQQEIQTYLKITESDEGSRIVASWKS